MKQMLIKTICLALSFFLAACGTSSVNEAAPEPSPEHVHTFTKADCENPSVCSECGLENEPALGHTAAIGICSRCGQIVNPEHLEKLRQDFMKVVETGAEVPSHFMNVDGKGASEHYSAFTEADPVIDEFNQALEETLKDCEGYEELNYLAYQIQLLMSRTPTMTSSSDHSYLVDKTDEYICFLVQFSSTVKSCTDEIYALYGKKGTPIGEVQYFEEMPDMPKPDNVIYSIQYLYEESDAGEKRYSYVIDDETDQYDSNFKNYLFILNHSGWLSAEKNGNDYQVIKNGRVVSVIRYGKDADGRSVMTVVFPQ